MKSDEELLAIFHSRKLWEPFYNELNEFLKARKNSLNTHDSYEMKHWYDVIYTSLKDMAVHGVISDDDFQYLTFVAGNLEGS